ncbi:regulatory protein RecX [Paenibacillus kandeliae]|uniref:regulatory protein RecX n=1 Tax=Paenibacillus kandeliae TaxID=3231269 RepID=UPI00345851A0
MNNFRSFRKSSRKSSRSQQAETNEQPNDWESEEEELDQKADRLDDFPDNGELEIISVEPVRWPRFHYRLTFGELNLIVHEDVMIKYRMLKGYSFTKDALQEIMAANELQAAYASSVNYLSYRSRTRTEVARKLREKEYESHVIEATLERLEQEKLIDDGLFAQQWAKQRVRTQKKGKVWIRQELRQKGVDQEQIEQALGDIDEDEELNSAVLMAQKKWNSTSGQWLDKKRKTMAYLMRRGYSSDLIRRALAQVEQKQDEDEEE